MTRVMAIVFICSVNICPGDICPYEKYIICYCLNFDQTLKVDSKILILELDHFYWPDADQTLKVGSWNHLYQMPTIMVIFVQTTFVHIRNISLTQFGPNFKGRFQTKLDFLFLEPDHFTQKLCTQNLLDSKTFWTWNFFWI